MTQTKLLLTLLSGAMLFSVGCANPGHFAGGGQLAVAFNGICDPSNAADCETLPFSLNVQAKDVDGNGFLDENDRIHGHLSIQPPKGARQGGNRFNGNVVFGGVCSIESLDAGLCQITNTDVPPFFPALGGSPIAQEAIKTHPKEGFAFLYGFARLDGKNPDSCTIADVACLPFLALAFDTDPANFAGDGVVVITPAFTLGGFVARGNLSITQETVPVP